jgi:hypothetical protein
LGALLAMQIIRFVIYDKGGPVAEGVIWSDGGVALHWRDHKTSMFKSRGALDVAMKRSGGNYTITYDRAI